MREMLAAPRIHECRIVSGSNQPQQHGLAAGLW